MFSKYRNVLILALIMTVFYYVPFYVNGFSNDVWIRLARIQEWANAGFPLKETLMMGQNYPYGHEMHWTRPLDWIGYAFAWPFIPNWGLHKSLEMMAYFTPVLTLCVGVWGFFYGLKGYLTPKAAFISFWLFFWSIGYVWGQSNVGYFDHHVFHFTLLVWVIAFIARSFLFPKEKGYPIAAGVLTAIGTWITAEFFINSYIVAVPFILFWIFKNKSLKPLLYYTAAYTIVLFIAMIFDHPMDGFWTLDFYRVSLLHILLGAINIVGIVLLMGMERIIQTTVWRRLIWIVFVGSVFLCGFILYLGNVLIVPMANPIMDILWLKYIAEMTPGYKYPIIINVVALPILISIGALIFVCRKPKGKSAAIFIISATGVLFYASIMIFHLRVGISLQAFSIFLWALFFNYVFFPREKSFRLTFLFVVCYLIFIGTFIRGDLILNRVMKAVRTLYAEDQQNNVNVTPKNNKKESTIEKYACKIPDNVMDVVKKDAANGMVFVGIYDAPQVLWETGKPILSGPYHTNVSGTVDLFWIMYDGKSFKRAKKIIDDRKITQFVLVNPGCLPQAFGKNEFNGIVDHFDNSFYHTVYYQKKNMPKWLELEFVDEKSNVKVFRIKPEKQPSIKKSK